MFINNWERNKRFCAAVVLHRFNYIQEYYIELSEYINSRKKINDEKMLNLNQENENTKNIFVDDHAAEYYKIRKVL